MVAGRAQVPAVPAQVECRDPRRMNSVAMSGGSAHQPMNRSRLGCRTGTASSASGEGEACRRRPVPSALEQLLHRHRGSFQVPRNTSAKPPTATRSRKRSSAGAMVHSAAARTPAAASAAPSMSGEDARRAPPASAVIVQTRDAEPAPSAPGVTPRPRRAPARRRALRLRKANRTRQRRGFPRTRGCVTGRRELQRGSSGARGVCGQTLVPRGGEFGDGLRERARNEVVIVTSTVLSSTCATFIRGPKTPETRSGRTVACAPPCVAATGPSGVQIRLRGSRVGSVVPPPSETSRGAEPRSFVPIHPHIRVRV